MIPPGVGPSGWMPSLAAGGTFARSWGVCHSPQVLGPSFSSLFQLRCLRVFSGINPFLDVGGAHSINTRETEASSLQHPWQSHRTPRASARFLPRGQLLRRPWGNLLPTRNCIPPPLQEHPGPTASTLGPTGREPGIVLSTLGTASCAALQTPRSRDCHYPLEMRELRLRVAMELAHRSTPLERGDLNPGIVASTPARFTAALDWLFRAATLQNLCTSTPVPRAFTRRATDIAEHPRSLRLCPRPG